MEKYLGVKLIDAEPEVKIGIAADKNTLRKLGVETILDGYKVVYEDDYVSWSPKDAFEKAYKRVKLVIPEKEITLAHQIRVIDEAKELQEKVYKLHTFINDNKLYVNLDIAEKERLVQQYHAMQYYLTILIERIENF